MHSFRETLYYFWKKVAEKQRRQHFLTEIYEIDMERFNNCKERKDPSQIKKEMNILQKYWGCKPLHYYYHDFYRKDCKVTIEEMKKFVPDYFIYNLFYPRSFKDYGILCEDKGLTYAILKGYNLSQPKMIFRFDDGKFYDEFNGPINGTIVDELINASKAEKLFVKPNLGMGGKGILIFNKKDQLFINEKGVKLEYNLLKKEVNEGSYVVQEGMIQSEEMNKLYSHSANTYRMVTECVNGEAKLVFSLLRMGSGGKQVDNASSGGLFIKIDPETGKMAEYAYTKYHTIHYEHPDTKFVYKDAKFSNWEEVKDFVLIVATKFRDIKYLGWDIAVSDKGPVVIEINNGPSLNLIQDCYGGIRDVLKINPKEWWYNSKYTIKEL
ncbi:MAG: sugar-transfer associated ATP-grasp domain-containing protein [Bacteroidota bacterium]